MKNIVVMKKNIIMVAAAMLALMAISCTKENENTQLEVKHMPISITATYERPGTKIAYTDDGTTISAKWESGDKILVAYDGYVSELTLSSGGGTTSATFTGDLTYTHAPSSSSLLSCYVKDKNNASAVTIDGNNNIVYSDASFLTQTGTVTSAGGCNTYFGMAKYGDGSSIKCAFSVNTSILKLSKIFAPEGISSGDEATLTYKSGSTELAKATFTVGTNGKNDVIYLAVPAGIYSGTQTLVYKSGETTKVITLSDDHANFAVGQTYSKTGLIFGYINLAYLDGDYSVDGDVKIIGSPTATRYITISEGAVVTLDNVTATTSNKYLYLRATGNATITLSGTNALNGGASIMHVVSGKTLTIQGTGSITSSVTYGGVIGSANSTACGNVIINSGTITATVTSGSAAGIGCQSSYGCGSITINGGNINLTGYNAAGIGTTNNGGTCGAISITGGSVRATGSNNSAGIGTGNSSSTTCGNIAISGGTVVAIGGTGAAGIGTSAYANKNNKCGTIDIATTVTSVTATKGTGATESIGKGNASSTCGIVTIAEGANVTQN